jgi:hypothetical protein
MSESRLPPEPSAQIPPEEAISALFANLVIQQTNMALMLLGRTPNPETGERIKDLDAARYLIDQLEMLEIKTKGNLDKREDQLLKQSLTNLRMAFVEAVETRSGKTEPEATAPPPPPAAAPDLARPPEPDTGEGGEEPRKKFSKKY